MAALHDQVKDWGNGNIDEDSTGVTVPEPPRTAADFLRHCFEAGVRAVMPREVFAAIDLPPSGGVPWLIAAGKAAEGMAAALAARLAARGTPIAGGIVIGAEGGGPVVATLEHYVGDHPLPGVRSRAASEALAATVARIPAEAEVHVLISGGATALMASPAAGCTDDELTAAFERLQREGRAIGEMNAERRMITRWGGGRLAAALAPRATHVWLISDVPGDDPATIGSGPCHGEPPLATVQHTVVASNLAACRGAALAAAALGCVQRLECEPLVGPAAEAGRRVALEAMRVAREWQQQNEALREDGHADAVRPLLLVCGGEATVTRDATSGLGGRAQELALAAAEQLDISPCPVTLLAAGTDGRDGPTDAAGAIVDQGSWTRLLAVGDPVRALATHDANQLLDRIGALIRTGPTGTNVMDLVLAVVGWEDAGRAK